MNICQESNKNQSCRRKSFRDSLLSTFIMKRIRLEKKNNTGLVGFQLNCNVAQSQILPPAYSTVLSSVSDLMLLKGN